MEQNDHRRADQQRDPDRTPEPAGFDGPGDPFVRTQSSVESAADDDKDQGRERTDTRLHHPCHSGTPSCSPKLIAHLSADQWHIHSPKR
jgi:hypothetical protein